MPWSNALIVIAVEIALGIICSRALIPCFRKLKTGKFEFYIGDRFAKDGSEPGFGGVIIAVPLVVGAVMSIGSTGQSLDANFENGGKKITAVVIFALLLMTIGLLEDWHKGIRNNMPYLHYRSKLIAEFALCLVFLIGLNVFCGDKNTLVLLPFRLGYVDFKFLYYPLLALGMTATVNAVKVHDCFGGDTENGVDGLCAVTSVVFSLIIAVCGNITDKWYVSAIGYVVAAAVMGFLAWGLSPSRIYLGESGALLLGGSISAMAVVSNLHLIIFMAGLGFLVDSVCTVLQYAVYRKSKRFIFKGVSLHSHWKVKGFNDYKIILIFTCMTIIGGIAGVIFALYSTKL